MTRSVSILFVLTSALLLGEEIPSRVWILGLSTRCEAWPLYRNASGVCLLETNGRVSVIPASRFSNGDRDLVLGLGLPTEEEFRQMASSGALIRSLETAILNLDSQIQSHERAALKVPLVLKGAATVNTVTHDYRVEPQGFVSDNMHYETHRIPITLKEDTAASQKKEAAIVADLKGQKDDLVRKRQLLAGYLTSGGTPSSGRSLPSLGRWKDNRGGR